MIDWLWVLYWIACLGAVASTWPRVPWWFVALYLVGVVARFLENDGGQS